MTFPLALLTLGIGFLGILAQRQRQAIYDLVADTVVVYAWDARAARLRWLARSDGLYESSVRESTSHHAEAPDKPWRRPT